MEENKKDMAERLLSEDALISYFSTLVGIIITVILIPIVKNIYTRKKNRHKKYLAEKNSYNEAK